MKPLATTVVIGLLVLLFARTAIMTEIALGKPNAASTLFTLVAQWIPHYAGLCLPFALFIGLMLGFDSLRASSELHAILANGVGLHQLLRPLLAVSIVISLAIFGLLGWVQPYALYANKSLVHVLQNSSPLLFAQAGVFTKDKDGVMLVEKLDRREDTFEKLFYYQRLSPHQYRAVFAATGSIVERVPGRPFKLALGKGIIIDVDEERLKELQLPLQEAGASKFQSLVYALGNLSTVSYRARGLSEYELSISELVDYGNNANRVIPLQKVSAELNFRFSQVAFIVLFPFIAICFVYRMPDTWRAYRFAFAGLFVIGTYEVLVHGALLARSGAAPPAITIWLPLGLLSMLCLVRFWYICKYP